MSFGEFYRLDEMPHSFTGDDFFIEKPKWNIRMISLIKNSDNIEELLKVFYQLSYKKVLQKRFNELSDIEKSELRECLPQKFKIDMELL